MPVLPDLAARLPVLPLPRRRSRARRRRRRGRDRERRGHAGPPPGPRRRRARVGGQRDMSRGGFGGMLRRQLRDDLAALPCNVRRRVRPTPAAERCGNIDELRGLAARRVPRAVFDYVDGAAGDELTAARNQSDLRRLSVSRGCSPAAPSSTSRRRCWVSASRCRCSARPPDHRDGPSRGRGRGGAGGPGRGRAIRAVLGRRRAGSRSSRALSPGPRWFQLYVSPDRGVSRSLIERAREQRLPALVMTVDVARAGQRERDRRNGFSRAARASPRARSPRVCGARAGARTSSGIRGCCPRPRPTPAVDADSAHRASPR